MPRGAGVVVGSSGDRSSLLEPALASRPTPTGGWPSPPTVTAERTRAWSQALDARLKGEPGLSARSTACELWNDAEIALGASAQRVATC